MGQKALKPQRKQLLLEAGTREGWRGWEGDKYPGSSLPPALHLASRVPAGFPNISVVFRDLPSLMQARKGQ